jgi:hypothetical protein
LIAFHPAREERKLVGQANTNQQGASCVDNEVRAAAHARKNMLWGRVRQVVGVSNARI